MQPFNDHLEKAKKKKFKKMKQMISDKLQNIKDDDISDSEQVDLSIELHPIRHYLDDKEEMIEQMFTSLGPTLIQNMLPPLLRTVPIHELKADCLIQLLGMSKKRVNTLIEGKELQSSSDSEFDSDDSDSEKKSVKKRSQPPTQLKAAKRKYIIDTDTLNVSIDDDDGLESLSLSDDETKKGAKKRKSSDKMKKCGKHLKSGTSSKKDNVAAASIGSTSPISISSDNDSDGGGSVTEIVENGEKHVVNPKKGKTLLEILELEMRAKAIRSLLNQNTSSPQPGNSKDGTGELFDPNIKIKAEPSETKRNPNPSIELDPDIIEIKEHVDEPIVVEDDDNLPNEKELSNGNDKSVSDSSSVNVKSVSAPLESDTNATKSVPEADKSGSGTTNPVLDSSNLQSINTEQTDPAAQGTSWSERYLDNKETEKLMKTSKMCTNIRKRMRQIQRAKEKVQPVKDKVEIPVVIGSISEYQKLIAINALNNSVKDAAENVASDVQNEAKSISPDGQNEAKSISPDGQNEAKSISPDEQNEVESISSTVQNEAKRISSELNETTSISPDVTNEAKSISPDVQNEATSSSLDGQNEAKSISTNKQNEAEIISPVGQNGAKSISLVSNEAITSDVPAANEDSRSPGNSERNIEGDILEIDIPIIDLDPECSVESVSCFRSADVSKKDSQTNGIKRSPTKERSEKGSGQEIKTPKNTGTTNNGECSKNVKSQKPEEEMEEGEIDSPAEESDDNSEEPIVIEDD